MPLLIMNGGVCSKEDMPESVRFHKELVRRKNRIERDLVKALKEGLSIDTTS